MEEVPMKQRDILLVPFPFSDRSGAKVRPVLVLSNDRYNAGGGDRIVCAITSNTNRVRNSILISQADVEAGTLHQKSAVRADSLLKMHQGLAIKTIGRLAEPAFLRVHALLQNFFRTALHSVINANRGHQA